MSNSLTPETVAAAIKAIEYKYFGDYEMSDDQREAVDVLVEVARQVYTPPASDAAVTAGEDTDEFETVEAWEHDDQRELSLLYNHKAHDRPQFNRGQMRLAIRHGRGLAAAAPKVASEAGAGLRQALRSIAEGNLGDAPWQANYARIRQVAADALATDATDGATGGGEVQRCQALVEAVRAGRFDALDAAADQWSESAGVQRMSNAIASVFEKYASQEIMDRFREKIAALMHLSFVEGAGQGVMQVADLATDAPAALATPKPPVDEAMRERIARFFCAFDNDGVASATVPQNDAFFAHWLAEDPQYYEAADALIRNLTGDGAGA